MIHLQLQVCTHNIPKHIFCRYFINQSINSEKALFSYWRCRNFPSGVLFVDLISILIPVFIRKVCKIVRNTMFAWRQKTCIISCPLRKILYFLHGCYKGCSCWTGHTLFSLCSVKVGEMWRPSYPGPMRWFTLK